MWGRASCGSGAHLHPKPMSAAGSDLTRRDAGAPQRTAPRTSLSSSAEQSRRVRPRTMTLAVLTLCAALTACGSTVQTTAGEVPVGGLPAADGLAEGDGLALDEGLGATTVPGAAGGPAGGSTGGGTTVGGLPGSAGAAAGGGSGGAPGAGGTSPGGGGVAAGPGAAAPGTKVTGPLKIGLLTVESAGAALRGIGAGAAPGTSEQEVSRALIRAYNDRGGMAGRMLDVVEFAINPAASNYETAVSAACARFTQDNKLPVVLSQLGGLYSENYSNCLAKAGVVELVQSVAAPDQQALRRTPLQRNVTSAVIDRRINAVLKGLKGSGYLNAKSKIGVIVENCPETLRAYDATFKPLVKQLGFGVVERRDFDCIRGFQDVGRVASQIQSAVLPFQSDSVDRVLMVTPWEPLIFQFFEQQAQSQGYEPSYGLSSIFGATVNGTAYDPAQLARVRGIGWLPLYDVAAKFENAESKRCLTMAAEGGVRAESQLDAALIRQICEQFFVLEATIKASGGRVDAQSFGAGLQAAAKSFTSVMQLGGRTRLGQAPDSPTVFAEYAYGKGCGCFEYVTKPSPIA
jgi:hypothetical protein